MNQLDTDTICAMATAAGKSGIAIVRVSGPGVTAIARRILGNLPKARYASFCKFHDHQGQAIDQGIALYYPAPASFTGEDVLELQGHGGLLTVNLLLQTAMENGARLARPGEFSERAFLNDKLDLTQLEAIADLIDAETEAAARSAFRTFDGVFSRLINTLVNDITDLRVYIEAAIDFADEEIEFLEQGRIQEKLQNLSEQLQEILLQARQGALLREGINVVIAGQPNAGKSSLLNQLAGRETAIVTEIPGTTRDLLRESINLDGMPLHIVDTAGLRDSDDPVEQEGVRRARQAIAEADQILLLIDSQRYPPGSSTVEQQIQSLGLQDAVKDSQRVTAVFNKADLVPAKSDEPGRNCLSISCKTGDGIAALRKHLKAVAGFDTGAEGNFIARRRHLDALSRAAILLHNADEQSQAGASSELVAEDLRLAQRALGEITGEVSSDDLLGKIFSSFCVGK